MNLEFYYWYFKNALSKDKCDSIINYGNSKREELALTGGQTEKIKAGKELSEEEISSLKKKRDSNISWLNDRWLYDEIHPYVHTANKNAKWNFEWDWSESVQFTKYRLNQYYGWHQDSWNKVYDDTSFPNYRNKIRKLSVVVQLSDPKEYKGGDFEINFRDKDPGEPENIRKIDEIKPQGSIIVFPSFVWHRVTSVTEGTRYSLVCWNLGYPFK